MWDGVPTPAKSKRKAARTSCTRIITFYAGYMASQIAREYGVPFVLTEHSSNFVRGRVFLPGQHRVVRHTLDICSAVTAVGPSIAEALSGYRREPVEVIGNVVDTDFFRLAPPPESGPFTVSIVARLIPLKRVDLVIAAFAAVFGGLDARLLIGGDGAQADQLRQQAREAGIEHQVEFLGWMAREQVRDLYHRSHVIVSASRFETFGLTLAEAMSCGRPVIATRSGGPEGFVTPETGVLVAVDDVDAMADAMRHLHGQYADYDPAVIRARCDERFSRAAMRHRLEAIYQQAVNSGLR